MCPGVCVIDQFAEYCEAWLTTDGLCEIGLKCCVPPEKFGDQLPAGLKILKNSNTVNLHQSISTSNHTINTSTTTTKPVSFCSLMCFIHLL